MLERAEYVCAIGGRLRFVAGYPDPNFLNPANAKQRDCVATFGEPAQLIPGIHVLSNSDIKGIFWNLFPILQLMDLLNHVNGFNTVADFSKSLFQVRVDSSEFAANLRN